MNKDAGFTIIFNGSIPQHYDDYLGPLFFEDYAKEVASRIDVPSVRQALELSCGTGRVTHHIRKTLSPTSHFVASDISEEMLAIAKAKLKDAAIEWRTIDAQKLPFDDDSLDLVVCCFGYMFVPDKVAAFAEARRVLRPGGTLLLTTWDTLEHNGASNVFRKTLKKYFGDTLPETYKLPFSMNDPEAIRNDLLKAGFLNVNAEVIEKNSVCTTAKEATYGLVRGGSLYNEIIKRNKSWVEEISATVEMELTERYGAAPMVAPMRAILCQAIK